MSHKVNLVRVLTAATGNSTPITLGAAYSQLFMLPSEAGAMDGRTYTYNIVDGNNWEIGRGVYTASGASLARTTILASRIGGTLGTSRITLSGTAQVRFIDSADDMDGVRGTRPVTGTTDTLNNSDLGFVVTYSNASAIAVSLAQASVSNLFLDGWAVWVKNKGAGAVTITSATSTIDGATTLVLAQNQGALIWSDGTNYQSFSLRNDIGVPVRTDTSQSLTSTQQAQARANIGASNGSPGLTNGKLVEGIPSAGSVTYALKTLAGNDASTANPIIARFPDGSAVTLTAALSVTLPSGATFGFTSAVAAYVWWALVNDGGTLRIAARNCSDATGIAGFPPNGILSSTVLNTSSDNVRVTYTDTAVTAKPYVIVGRSEYDSGLTTAGTWTAASRVVQWVTGMPLPGSVVQIPPYASTTTVASTSSTTYQATNLSLSVTPTHAANLIRGTFNGSPRQEVLSSSYCVASAGLSRARCPSARSHIIFGAVAHSANARAAERAATRLKSIIKSPQTRAHPTATRASNQEGVATAEARSQTVDAKLRWAIRAS